jgi:O-antigen/teichoic acid export membrane protein
LLGADGLGQITVVTTITGFGGVIASMGVSDLLVRRIAQQPRNLAYDATVGLAIQLMAAVLTALAIVVGKQFADLGAFDPLLLYLALIGMLFTPVTSVLLSILRGREQHRQYAWLTAAIAAFASGLGVLVLLFGASLPAYQATLVVSGTAITIVSWKLARVRLLILPLNRTFLRTARELIVQGFPFLSWSLILTVTGGVDRLVLGWFVPAAEVGWYAAALRIVGIPIVIPTLVITPLYPALSRNAGDSAAIRRAITETLRLVLVLMVPMCAGIIGLASAIPTLLGWPPDFVNSVPLMVVLSLQLPVIAVDMVLGTVLMAIGLQGRWVMVGVAGAALKFGLSVWLVPIFESSGGNGAMAASIVTIASELLMFAGALILLPRQLLEWRPAWDGARVLAASIALAAVAAALLPLGVVVAFVGSSATYVLGVWAMRAVTLADVRLIMDRLQRSRGQAT